MKQVKLVIIVKEEDWDASIYKTLEWEQSVILDRWTHDFELKEYKLEYFEKQ